MDSALVVVAPSPDGQERQQAAVAADALGDRCTVTIIDLAELEVAPAMSMSERRAYHSDQPILAPLIAEHARLVSDAAVLVFIFPTAWWTPPAILKAWVERTFVPGVSFVLDDRKRVVPALGHLRAVVGITRQQRSDEVRRAGDGARRMLLRTLRLNATGRVRTAWVTVPTEGSIRTALENV